MTKRELSQVQRQIGFADVVIRAHHATLEQAPEILKAVRVDVALGVAFGVVDCSMEVFRRKAFVRSERVSVDLRARFDVLFDFAMQSAALGVRNDHRFDLPLALKDAKHDSLAYRSAAVNLALALMHISGSAADEGFIDFNFTRQFF